MQAHGAEKTRETRLQAACSEIWDAVIVGGGITGAGILRECARLGLKAILIEKHDFAWGTSSKSSKMVHGGLRYLASGQFGLTRDAVHERQRLLGEIPGLVAPLPFVMGHYAGEFPPASLFNLLLRVYDGMAGQVCHQRHAPEEAPFWVPGMKTQGLKAFTRFQDAVTDDARLTLRVIQQACREGALALNYCSADEVLRDGEGRARGVRITDRISGETCEIRSSAVINATGAWASALRGPALGPEQIRPLRGSHLVFPRWRVPVALSISYLHPADKRPVFVFPWEGVTVAGTTDLDHQLDPEKDVAITREEVHYLLDGLNHILPSAHLSPADVLSTWAGVRPVVSEGKGLDPSREKREHSIWDDQGLITVAGGKLTTFRLIARDVLKVAAPWLNLSPASIDAAEPRIFDRADAEPAPLVDARMQRWIGRYGKAGAEVIRSAPGARIGATPWWEGELHWILAREMVEHLDDLMLRRTRLGNILPGGGREILDQVGQICQARLGWEAQRWDRECERYLDIIRRYFSLPEDCQ